MMMRQQTTLHFHGGVYSLTKAWLIKYGQLRGFQSEFIVELKQGYGALDEGRVVITKYFLLGVLPAFRSNISPLHEVGENIDILIEPPPTSK